MQLAIRTGSRHCTNLSEWSAPHLCPSRKFQLKTVVVIADMVRQSCLTRSKKIDTRKIITFQCVDYQSSLHKEEEKKSQITKSRDLQQHWRSAWCTYWSRQPRACVQTLGTKSRRIMCLLVGVVAKVQAPRWVAYQ